MLLSFFVEVIAFLKFTWCALFQIKNVNETKTQATPILKLYIQCVPHSSWQVTIYGK